MSKPPPKIPLVVDNREQNPLSFNADRFDVSRGTLKTGDVSVKGLEDVLCVEWKELGDLVSTLLHDFLRFRKQLIRMSGFTHAIIVTRASMDDILEHRYESDGEPAAVLGRINGILIDHAIPTIFCGSRHAAETYIEQYLTLAVKKLGGVPC